MDSNVSKDGLNLKFQRVLKTETNYLFLPKNVQNTIGYFSNGNLIPVSPGWYQGFSIKDAIIASLYSFNAHFTSECFELGLLVGCDGTNVGRSTNSQFWPTIWKLCLDGAKSFDIGLYQGHAKPDDVNTYLKHFRG